MKWSSTHVNDDLTEDSSSGRWFAIKRTFYWSRPLQIASMMLADAVIIVMAAALAYFTRFEGSVPDFFLERLPVALVLGMAVFIATLWGFGLYHLVLRYVGITMMTRLTAATAVTLALLGLTDFVFGRMTGARPVPLGVVLIFGAFAFVGLAALRSLGRLWVVMSAAINGGEHRVLIVGAGDAGSLLLRDIETQPHLGYDVVGLLDDRPVKHNLTVRGVRVLGPIEQVAEVVAEYDVHEIMVAIPSATIDRRREVLELCSATGVPTRVVPGFALQTHEAGVADLRPVAIEDLLGRAPNEIDLDLIAGTLRGKVVAVTGAAGSIGSELCRQIMRMHPRRLLLLEIDESRLYELALEMESLLPGVAVMHICDVRDSRKLMRIFRQERPQVVFHAAAYKHVPIMESEPDEAVRTNVLGTINVLKACAEVGVERFVLISTDKAVDPRNIMGATKALAERVMIAAASRGVGAVAVRFGNVLGSRGSVIPIFEEQLRNGGPITVTHPDVTRFFMTIPEAVRLVLQAQAMSDGADVFVLDMGEPIRIVDLAQRMISLSGVHTHIEYTGLRPGEKLHEILVHGDTDLVPTSCPVVRRLNALPCITPEFAQQIGDLLLNARLGRGAEIRELLALMTDGQFEASDQEEGDS